MRVFVLLFNTGTDNEGIHTIQVRDPSDPAGVRNKVLMFESEDDATRFAVLLEAQDFPTPTVQMLEDLEIKEFCDSVDYDWELIPNGALVIPPESNVEKSDWEKDQKPEIEEGEMSPSELDRIRRQLEGLL